MTLVEKTELSRFGQIPESTALEQIVSFPVLSGTEIAFLKDSMEGDSLMKPRIQARHSQSGDRKRTTQARWLLLTSSLLLLLMGMPVTVVAEERPFFTAQHYLEPTGVLPLHLLARRYGVTEAVNLSFQAQAQEQARREMARLKEAQRRDEELRKKVTELAQTSLQLYQRFADPSKVYADTPQLAKRCEELAQAIKKLLR